MEKNKPLELRVTIKNNATYGRVIQMLARNFKKMKNMPKFNEDLYFSDLYERLKKREQTYFIANRSDIGFDNIESELTGIDFDLPFRLPVLQNIETIIDILLRESTGQVSVDPYQKIRLLVKVFGGEILYHKIDDGDEWRVIIVF